MRSVALGKVSPNGHKVRLPAEADELLVSRARRSGMSVGQYLSKLAMLHLYGVDELVRMQRQELEVLSRSGPA